jgi:hypothetical protein
VFEQLKTYLFGVAIGSVLVAMILLAKADLHRRQQAAVAAQSGPSQASPTSSPDSGP